MRWKFGNLLAVFEIYRWIKLYALPPCFPVSKVYGTKTLIEFQGLLWGPSLPLSVHPEGWGQGQGGQNPIHPNQDHQRRQPNTNHVQLGAATTKFHGKKKSPMHGSRTCSSKPFQWIPTRGNILLILISLRPNSKYRFFKAQYVGYNGNRLDEHVFIHSYYLRTHKFTQEQSTFVFHQRPLSR